MEASRNQEYVDLRIEYINQFMSVVHATFYESILQVSLKGYVSYFIITNLLTEVDDVLKKKMAFKEQYQTGLLVKKWNNVNV